MGRGEGAGEALADPQSILRSATDAEAEAEKLYQAALARGEEISNRYREMLREAAAKGFPPPQIPVGYTIEGHSNYRIEVCAAEIVYESKRKLFGSSESSSLKISTLVRHIPAGGYDFPADITLLEDAQPKGINGLPLTEIRVFDGPEPTVYKARDLKGVDQLRGPELASPDQMRAFLNAVGEGMFEKIGSHERFQAESMSEALKSADEALKSSAA